MSPIIALTTDFGHSDAYVGVMKGVIARINPGATVTDLCHGIRAHDLLGGALILRSALPYFPTGTVHVVVIDPGVGTKRKPILVETADQFLIGPDNGVLEPAASALGRGRAFCLTNPQFQLAPVSRTFHGRDIFAPAAAHLTLGVPPEAFGPTLDSIHSLDIPEPERKGTGLTGQVLYVDSFANLVTNIPSEGIQDSGKIVFRLGSQEIMGLAHSYEDVPRGHYLAIAGSWGLIEISQREGRAGDSLKAGLGDVVEVEVDR
jgi:S-adenosylmethionine hydrolase